MDILQSVGIAALATVGLLEYLKNFTKALKAAAKVYTVLMPIVAIICYYSVTRLPQWVTGGLLSIGAVQLGYQAIVQGFNSIIDRATNKSVSLP